jgi:16S rRNA (guanine527-N7)-methyltransferase
MARTPAAGWSSSPIDRVGGSGRPAVGRTVSDELIAQLERARALGFLGPGEVQAHIDHAAGFLEALAGVRGDVVDLGSGGGVPGLVVGVARPDLHLVLLDATAKRCRFLEAAVAALELDAEVAEGRAEVLGRGRLRGTASAVLARSFAAPAPTAECAAPLLAVGGRLVVSEPPDGRDRWPADGLAPLGLEVGSRSTAAPHVQVLLQARPCPQAYPRREGVPAKRPLF